MLGFTILFILLGCNPIDGGYPSEFDAKLVEREGKLTNLDVLFDIYLVGIPTILLTEFVFPCFQFLFK